MKARRKLIPAIVLLLVSVLMLSTASYAWFANNTVVTATGMSVTANTDSAFLIITEGTTLSGKATTATHSGDVSLKPVAPVTTLTSTNVGAKTNWGTAVSDDPEQSKEDATVTPFTDSVNLTDYVKKYQFMVGIVENSGEVSNPLKIKKVAITPKTTDIDGVTVVVVCGTNIYTFDATDTTSTNKTLAEASAVNATGVLVDVYVYINGKNEDVKSVNATNIGADIEIEFTINKLGA